MPTRPNKTQTPGESPAGLFAVAGLVIFAVLAMLFGWVAATLAGVGHGSPAVWAWALVHGPGPSWSTAATWWAVTIGVLLVVAVLPPVVAVVRWSRRRVWTDPLASAMSSARDEREMGRAGAPKDAARLGASAAGVGLPLGRSVRSGQSLFGLYEWSQIWVLGTRAGKTRSVAIPQLSEHHGPAVTTSNKRDLHDATLGPRGQHGRCWVNDPQGITSSGPTTPAAWWWNPVGFASTVERAAQLADLWSAARSNGDMAGLDPYFEPEGRSLLAALLLAANLDHQPVTRLVDWTTGVRPGRGVPDPAAILAAHGFTVLAAEVANDLRLDDGQRDGIYGTARSFIRFLGDPRFVAWMTPTGPEDHRPVFDPAAFVRSAGDTLYLLSKEGAGSARALSVALTVATYTAAEDYAQACGDRVATPILFLLDEAANVCRWPQLPDLFSHAGGKGLLLVVILQSRAQGQSAWGRDAFKKMWSAANVACFGRGLGDADDLEELSALIGDRQILDRSRSVGTQGHRTTSTQRRDERIFTAADLRAFPAGRAVLFSTGNRPILLALVDYSTYPWAALAQASRDWCREDLTAGQRADLYAQEGRDAAGGASAAGQSVAASEGF